MKKTEGPYDHDRIDEDHRAATGAYDDDQRIAEAYARSRFGRGAEMELER